MKNRNFIILGAIILLVAAYLYYDAPQEPQATLATYTNQETGLVLNYPRDLMPTATNASDFCNQEDAQHTCIVVLQTPETTHTSPSDNTQQYAFDAPLPRYGAEIIAYYEEIPKELKERFSTLPLEIIADIIKRRFKEEPNFKFSEVITNPKGTELIITQYTVGTDIIILDKTKTKLVVVTQRTPIEEFDTNQLLFDQVVNNISTQ